MAEFWQALGQVFVALRNLIVQIHPAWLLLAAWVAWWLWAVNWRKAWPVLAQGAWAPVVLLCLIVTLIWWAISPGGLSLFGTSLFSGLWGHLLAVGLILGLALFCGWLQGVLGQVPAEVEIEPAIEHAHSHDHGHVADAGHDHGQAHAPEHH